MPNENTTEAKPIVRTETAPPSTEPSGTPVDKVLPKNLENFIQSERILAQKSPADALAAISAKSKNGQFLEIKNIDEKLEAVLTELENFPEFLESMPKLTGLTNDEDKSKAQEWAKSIGLDSKDLANSTISLGHLREKFNFPPRTFSYLEIDGDSKEIPLAIILEGAKLAVDEKLYAEKILSSAHALLEHYLPAGTPSEDTEITINYMQFESSGAEYLGKLRGKHHVVMNVQTEGDTWNDMPNPEFNPFREDDPQKRFR